MAGTSRRKHELVSGPLKKIKRAQQHINDLNREVTEFLSRKPFQLRVSEKRDPHRRIIYIKAKEPIPEIITMILGDAVHNLRSAIDQLAWGIVGSKAKKPRQVGFPFVETAEALSSAIATRQMNVAPEKVIEEIHLLQPYPSGNKYLHAVKSLDETDKHRNILIVATGLEISAQRLQEMIEPHKLPVPMNVIISVVGDWSIDLTDTPPAATFDKEADFQPAFTIGFGQGEALESFPLIMALANMADATEAAVRRIAKAAFS